MATLDREWRSEIFIRMLSKLVVQPISQNGWNSVDEPSRTVHCIPTVVFYVSCTAMQWKYNSVLFSLTLIAFFSHTNLLFRSFFFIGKSQGYEISFTQRCVSNEWDTPHCIKQVSVRDFTDYCLIVKGCLATTTHYRRNISSDKYLSVAAFIGFFPPASK